MQVLVCIIWPLCGACAWISAVVVALCFTEIPRFLFYTGYCDAVAAPLRYNLFLVIMPLNQVTEFMTCFKAFQNVPKDWFAVPLPEWAGSYLEPRWLLVVVPGLSIVFNTPKTF